MAKNARFGICGENDANGMHRFTSNPALFGRYMRFILFLFLLSATFGQNAHLKQMDSLSTVYMNHARAVNLSGMTSMMADSIRYIDFTWQDKQGQPALMVSRDSVHASLNRQVFQHTVKYEFDVKEKFVSGFQAVIRGRVTFTFDGGISGRPTSERYLWAADITKVLTFDGDKISTIHDYVNYPKAVWRQLK